MVCKERAEALLKIIRWAFWQFFIIFLSLFASQATSDCSVLCDHFVWRGKTKRLVYSHETDHCLSRTASSEKRERLLVVYMFAGFASRAITVKMFKFVRVWYHLKKAWEFPVNRLIKFGPCWEAPYLWLVTYWQLMLSDKFRKWWVEYRNTGSYSRRSPPFSPLSGFSPSPLPLPFLSQPRRLKGTRFREVLKFSLSLDRKFSITGLGRFRNLGLCCSGKNFLPKSQ